MKRLELVAALAAAVAIGAALAQSADASRRSCWDARGPAPAYPDTEQALDAAPDDFAFEKLMWDGRELRDQRLAEDDRLIRACARP